MNAAKQGILETPDQDQMDVLLRVSHSIEHTPYPETLCWRLANSLMPAMGLTDGIVFLKTGPQRLKQVAAFGSKAIGQQVSNPLVIEEHMGIVGRVAQTGQAETIVDTQHDDRYLVDDALRRSELTVPIVYDGEVLGILDSEHEQRGFYTNQHQSLFTLCAALIAPRLAHLQAKQRIQVSVNSLIKSVGPQISLTASDTAEKQTVKLVPQLPAAQLSESVFTEAVAQALKAYHCNPKLQQSALIESHLVTQTSTAASESLLTCLKQVLHDHIDAMQQTASTRRWGLMLRRRYIESTQSQAILADQFHMADSTFRRHLKQARDHLCVELWQKECSLNKEAV